MLAFFRSQASRSGAPARTKLLKNISGLLLAIGLMMYGLRMFHAVIFNSLFTRIHGDLGDARLINLFLEHNYLALFNGWPATLTSTPWAFFPFPSVYFFTDTLLGSLPFYAFFRWCTANMYSGFQLWMITTSVLNYLSMLLLLRQGMRFSWLAAIAGAYLFAFNLPRSTWSLHPQLMAQFYTPLAILFLLQYFRSSSVTKRGLYLGMFAVLVAWQCWASFYLGWFLIFGLALTAVVALKVRSTRSRLLQILNEDRYLLLVAIAVGGVLLLPLYIGHNAAKDYTGWRSWGETSSSLPQITSYFFAHPSSWAYGTTMSWIHKFVKPGQAPEWHVFSGFIAMLAPLLLWRLRRTNTNDAILHDPVVSFSLKVLGWLVVLTFASRTGYSLWWGVYHTFPGAAAVRAMCRISLFYSFLVGILLAAVISWLQSQTRWRWSALVASALLVGVVAENQMTNLYGYSITRSEQRVRDITYQLKNCESFYVRTHTKQAAYTHVDAMIASMQSRIPTMNGYVGNVPPGWDLDDVNKVSVHSLSAWLQKMGQQYSDKHCLITVSDRPDE